MKFTIIIPVYNKEKYLRRCLDSVVNQTCRDFECLLIDDGSTDNSNAICKEYEANFSFFRVYEKENGGLSDARNYGIERASGEYLAFLDADDCIDKNLIYICETVLKNHDVDVIAFGMVSAVKTVSFDYKNEMPYITKDDNLIYNILNSNTGVSVCNKVFKKALFYNLKFIKGRLFEDQFIIFKLLKGRNIIVLNNSLYFYFQDIDNSLSKRKIYSETYDYLEAAIEIAKDVSYEEKYLMIANQTVYERIVILLTNVYYREGQF